MTHKISEKPEYGRLMMQSSSNVINMQRRTKTNIVAALKKNN